MIKVTVAQSTVRQMSGTSKTTGKPYDMRFQTVYLHTVDQDGNPPPYPEKTEVILNKDQAAFPVGEYQLHPSSVYIDRNGSPAISLRLTPVAKAPAPAKL